MYEGITTMSYWREFNMQMGFIVSRDVCSFVLMRVCVCVFSKLYGWTIARCWTVAPESGGIQIKWWINIYSNSSWMPKWCLKNGGRRHNHVSLSPRLRLRQMSVHLLITQPTSLPAFHSKLPKCSLTFKRIHCKRAPFFNQVTSITATCDDNDPLGPSVLQMKIPGLELDISVPNEA